MPRPNSLRHLAWIKGKVQNRPHIHEHSENNSHNFQLQPQLWKQAAFSSPRFSKAVSNLRQMKYGPDASTFFLEFLSSSLSISFSEMSLSLSSWKTTHSSSHSNLSLFCYPSLHSLSSSLHSAPELSDIVLFSCSISCSDSDSSSSKLQELADSCCSGKRSSSTSQTP